MRSAAAPGVGMAADPELAELQRQARALAASRSSAKAGVAGAGGGASAADEGLRTVAAQRAQIEKLRRENAELHEELAGPQKTDRAGQSDRLKKLEELVDTYSRKIEVEGRQLESISQEIELTHARLGELRRVTAGVSGGAGAASAQRHMQVLENRLEQAEKRFGDTLAENRSMREEIESLNKTREMFEAKQLKVEKELAAWREKAAELSTSVAVAGEARTIAVASLESLRTQADKEQAFFEAEARQLSRVFESDSRLLDAQAKRLERLLDAPNVDESSVQEDGVGPSFEHTAAQLSEAAGLDRNTHPLSTLVAHYRGLEASNFAAFNACNAANEEISELQRKARALENEARQLEVEGVLGKQKGAISATLSKRDAADMRADGHDQKRRALERRLAALRGAVAQVLSALGGKLPAEAGPPAHGASSDAVAAALAAALGAAEMRARAVLAVWGNMVGKSGAAAAASAPGAKAPAGAAARPQQDRKAYRNKLYNNSDDDSDDSEDEVPLTRNQIQARIAARAQK